MQERLPYETCPLCGGPFKQVGTANCSSHPCYHPSLSKVIQWERCTSCGHVFTSGYHTPEALRLMFSKTQAAQQVGVDLEEHRMVSARIVEKVLPFASSGLWLDVGFGNGSLLFTAKEFGFEPIGLDLREETVAALKQRGYDARCASLENVALPTLCSVISMADVLEHMPYPQRGLGAARKLLAQDGVLFVSMPNMESEVWADFDRRRANPYWGELEHYHNFSRSRLYSLLRDCGFEPVRYSVSERYRACMEVIARPRP